MITMSLKSVVMNQSLTLNQYFSILANTEYPIYYLFLIGAREKLSPHHHPKFRTRVVPLCLQFESLLNEFETLS